MPSIFSVQLSVLSKNDFFKAVLKRLKEGRQTAVATLNPEILLTASRNFSFARVINLFTFRVVDGVGIVIVLFLRKHRNIHRITGQDVLRTFMSLAQIQKKRVGVIGGRKDVSAKAVEGLRRKFSSVDLVDLGAGVDVLVSSEGNIIQGEDVFARHMEVSRPEIVFVGFGAPKQEFFIDSLLKKYPFVKCVAGIGGLVDVLSGSLRPVPRIISSAGLEWLWRLLQEPRRFTRIINAVMVFPVRALLFDRSRYEKK